MDPLSQLFAAYLEMVSNNITSAYVDAVNTTVTAQTLTYKGTDIRFQHFLWQVKQESVCADLKQQATSYSKCTQQAKAMFTDLCNQLSSHAYARNCAQTERLHHTKMPFSRNG
ncbi:hypothetical protein AYI75_12415 [Shewanella algae]|nr:hypothetical protein AYI75_12415 [Shewanella algae]